MVPKLSVESVELSTFGCKRKKGSETHKAYLIWVIPPLEFQYMVLHLILQANLHHSMHPYCICFGSFLLYIFVYGFIKLSLHSFFELIILE